MYCARSSTRILRVFINSRVIVTKMEVEVAGAYEKGLPLLFVEVVGIPRCSKPLLCNRVRRDDALWRGCGVVPQPKINRRGNWPFAP